VVVAVVVAVVVVDAERRVLPQTTHAHPGKRVPKKRGELPKNACTRIVTKLLV